MKKQGKNEISISNIEESLKKYNEENGNSDKINKTIEKLKSDVDCYVNHKTEESTDKENNKGNKDSKNNKDSREL